MIRMIGGEMPEYAEDYETKRARRRGETQLTIGRFQEQQHGPRMA